jgi:hypothetical protein
MVVVHQTADGTYIGAEMDDIVSRLWFATFHVIPYHGPILTFCKGNLTVLRR